MLAFALVLLALLLVGRVRAVTVDTPYTGSTREEFVEWLGPRARENNRRIGIPASVTIAQAALESGFGASRLTRVALNYFGIKSGSSWTGRVVSAPTREERADGTSYIVPGSWVVYPNRKAGVDAGERPDSLFRVYSSGGEGLADHGGLFYRVGVYRPALEVRHDPRAFAHALTRRYATDHLYGGKLIDLMNQYDLWRFDVPRSEWALDPALVPPEWRA